MIDSLATEDCITLAFDAYVDTALWSSTDENGDPFDLSQRHELSAAALATMREDVTSFLESCWGDLDLDLSPIEPEQIGHDFWLTRNGHGAGFWDRGLGELGDRLTALAKAYGSVQAT